ncbi:MAG: molybdopterin-dependent oxidoreductase, partial [Aestuariibacter sp.]|nr:molybdopterin-dependent oxidoreductase [Aestuariibacter sp.]
APAGYVHGLVSCSEWTGVPLSLLLQEAGLKPMAKWLVADGLDAAGVTVSIPVEKVMDDTLIALYQNGEPVRPENGFPARLLVPGWEGIVNVKWLRSLQLTDHPLMSRFDTVSYTDLLKDGTSRRFSYQMGVKSLITSPSPGKLLGAPGFHELRGLAWTGGGSVTAVEVSTDGGKSWFKATLQEPVLDKALTRFRAPWHWDGSPVVLKSRAYDSLGQLQPERAALLNDKGSNAYYHYNAIISWSVDSDGRVRHVYA